jgi:hypothetical protein
MAWHPDQVQNEDFINCLSVGDVAEIKQALRSFKGKSVEWTFSERLTLSAV